MKVDRQQLEKFHQHLVAIETAGFEIHSQLLHSPEQSKHVEQWPLRHGLANASMLRERLGLLIEQLGNRSDDDLMHWLSVDSTVTPIYLSSFQNWLNNQERIASLEHLLAEDDLQFSAAQGFRRARLHLAIFSVLGLVALTTVWGLSLHGIRQLVDQLRIEPPWALKTLLWLQPYYPWLLAGLVAGALCLGWSLARRAGLKLLHHDALRALQRAQLASRLSLQTSSSRLTHSSGLQAEDRSSEDRSSEDSPLLKWACQEATKQGLEASQMLELAKRLYLWMSLDRGQRFGIRGVHFSGLLIGGAVTLSAGLLLFYPLVQLLRSIIDTSGLAR